ncbi:FAD-linked oxidase [Kitasatospora xanthocidica]|uniref:FAD-binding oxidoreductase n=1 Tax=Kitasatospora xanthocidica TaxID=83382 RepID=UPI0019A2B8E9|nr:FAD-binding protein [Kitasatospora xanthocidica]GHF60244.1 FAD-linked oxidase [Kitasatospora xanthocidica]
MRSEFSRRGFLGGAGAAAAGITAGSMSAASAAGGAPRELPKGRSILPGDPRYQTLGQGFNQRWSSSPSYIRLVGNEADAVAELNRALDRGLRPTVRGGGHCYEGFVDNDRGVILDLSTMRGVAASTDKFGRPTYCVEGGATNWDVYTTLFREHAVTLPAGSCYSVGAGGHICGGGFGLLSRRHGLTVDHLVQVDVVTVRGGTAAVTAAHREDAKGSPEQDLFWAHTGGGGGNFGVVLRYHFAPDAPQPPPRVWLSSVAWPWEELLERSADFETLVRNFGTFMAEHSGPQESLYQGLFAILKLTHHSNGNVVLVSQWDGDDPAPLDSFVAAVEQGMATRSVVQTRAAGGLFLPYPEKRRQLPWFQATMTLNPSGDNRRGKYKSAYHREPFSPAQIATFRDWLTRDVEGADLSKTLVQIDSYGCRINTRRPEETAVPQRDSIMKLQYQTYWTDPAEDSDHLTYLRDFYRDVYRETGGVPEIDTATDGAYVNYPDVDLGTANQRDPAYPRLYYKDNYARLQRTKAYWDGEEVFHHAQSVRPAKA